MRTLLVDNYDSFTYNLFHRLAEVNGTEPEVIRNDDPGWRPGMLDAFDNVVLSPGPGTPHRAADVGICAEIAAGGRLPLLGVCLGHQGLALAHGARVHRAREPRHGRPSEVLHDGTGLFDGLPSPLEVIRYHSLEVSGLPSVLEPLAWTADGVLMALRHRDLPLWGVQFHPESIGTQGGHRLLANFGRLTEPHRRARPDRNIPAAREAKAGPPAGSAGLPATAPATAGGRPGRGRDAGPDQHPGRGMGSAHRPGRDPDDARRPGRDPDRGVGGDVAAASRPRRLRVLVRPLGVRCEPEVVFDRVFAGGDHPFWLDSGKPGDARGQLSVMGDAGGPLARVATADVSRGTVNVRSAAGTEVVRGAFLDWLEQDLGSLRVDVPELPFDFALGWVGYLGYELKADHEGDSAHRSAEPDAVMVFAGRAVVFDHRTGTGYLLALAEDGHEAPAAAWLSGTSEELTALAGVVPGPARPPVAPGEVEVRLRHDRDAYLTLIKVCQEEISAGESYEICLTNMIEARTPGLDPWQAYRFLRRVSPAPFGAFLRFGEVSVLSTSPERFLRIDRHRVIESRPVKGTRPRGATPEEDARTIAGLAASEKDRAENLMIVDLVRNDLGHSAVTGSVIADPVFQVETYASVHQLVSTVRAELRTDSSSVAAVRAAFPGGSMTGAPKIRTMRIIDALEGGPRGIYSGAIGYFSLTGAADLSIVIRTVVLHGNRLRYGVGGAVIALSDPEEEFEETAVKAAPVLRLLGAEFPGRRGVSGAGNASVGPPRAGEKHGGSRGMTGGR